MQAWIGAKIGRPTYSLAELREWQLARIQAVFDICRQKSPFYREHYAGFDTPRCWDDFHSLPFTDEAMLRRQGLRMLCVGQDEIARIVTLDTSGTTAAPKRVFFSAEDQELTVDFFRHGMATLTSPGDKVLILLPAQTPGSVGDLLAAGLRRMGAQPLAQGAPEDFRETARLLCEAQVVVANPLHMLMLAETVKQLEGEGVLPGGAVQLRSILLSTDYVADSLKRRLRRQFGCPVFEHYGMTEMGLGGGVSCSAGQGYHLREADLYVEIIDPLSCQPLPPGEYGEIVFSTLTRTALPLLRYRSGDCGRYLDVPCPCGSLLPRLDKVLYRLDGQKLRITGFDELFLGLDGLASYDIEVENGQIYIRAYGLGVEPDWREEGFRQALGELCCGHTCLISWQQGLPPQAGSLAKRHIKYL